MNKTTQTGNRIVLVGLVLLLLASMLWTIIRAYFAGGPDAPTFPILLLGIAVLGGGIAFAVGYLLHLLKRYPRKPAESQDAHQDCEKE